MEQGVIANLKHYYKSYTLKQLIRAIDNDQRTQISVLQAMRAIRESWNKVMQATTAFAIVDFR